ncbi:hypothetical protein A2U01_0090235, partial [Trifolium medium]|nr:hypothetical protein [Trifolium medium]
MEGRGVVLVSPVTADDDDE